MPKAKKNKQKTVFMKWNDVANNLREQRIEGWDDENILSMNKDVDVELMIDDFDGFLYQIDHELNELKEIIKQKKLYATVRNELGYEVCYLLDFLASYDRRIFGIMAPTGYWYNRETMVEIKEMQHKNNGRNTYLENAINNFIKPLLKDIQSSEPDDCHPEIKKIITPIIEKKLKELESV